MKAEYTKAQDIINKSRLQLETILKAAENNKALEDKEAYYTLDNIIERLERAEDYLNYLNTPTKKGILMLNHDNNKYYIAYDDGTESYDLSCGYKLELFLDDEWNIGRVEARGDGEYYFYGCGKPSLFTGMKARKRI